MKFNQKLKTQRLSLGIKQEQVADYLGVDKSTYSHYEAGRRTPSLKQIIKIIRYLKLPLSEIFPLEQTVKITKNTIKNLQNLIKKYENGTGELEANLAGIDEINFALDSFVVERDESLPDMDDLSWDEIMLFASYIGNLVVVQQKAEFDYNELFDKAVQCQKLMYEQNEVLRKESKYTPKFAEFREVDLED